MNIFTRFSWTALVVSLFLILTSTATAQLIDIPDVNLRNIIKGRLKKPAGAAITKADMQTLTLLGAMNADIRDLTGLEHAANLMWLNLDHNAISDITPLIALTQLTGLSLNNNPLGAETLDIHLPTLQRSGVKVSYTLPSDVNADGIVNIQDLVSVTHLFGTTLSPAADVNKDGIVNIIDLTQVASDFGDTTDHAAATDGIDAGDSLETASDEKAKRTDAFIFGEFIDTLIADLKRVGFNDAAFQTPGKGVWVFEDYRPPDMTVLGTDIPDVVQTASIDQVNRFSHEYGLTPEELINLLENLRRAIIAVADPRYQIVHMPDLNLRKVVVKKINELEIAWGAIHRPKKPSDPIFAGEMWEIEVLIPTISGIDVSAVGIESLTGLEYAINLRHLSLPNIYGGATWADWDVVWFPPEREGEPWKYMTTEPETPNIISDLTPLENLTDLRVLNFGFNNISDLTPLRNLTNLIYLNLAENKITNITPLANLINLEQVYLYNQYYSPLWAGNNRITSLAPLRNMKKLSRLDIGQNPIGASIDVVRNFPRLQGLGIPCCGVNNLRPLVETEGLRGPGSWVYLAYSPLLTAADVPHIKALQDRGVEVTGGGHWFETDDGQIFYSPDPEWCSESHRESFRAAPTAAGVLSSVWQELSEIPEETTLMPNYPNPFNPETWIPYQLSEPAEVTVAIHAADGQLVRTIALGHQPAGVYESKNRAAYWDGRNNVGERVASGVYFYTLKAGEFAATQKMLILK